jgi:hypothetical protein
MRWFTMSGGPVDQEEFQLAYEYTQRVIEDFYEHREEVERLLVELGRLKADASNERLTNG